MNNPSVDQYNISLDTKRSATNWIFPIIGFYLYIVFFVLGYFLNIPGSNYIGVSFMIFFLLIGNYQRMFSIKNDLTITIAFLIILLIFINLGLNFNSVEPKFLTKLIALFVLYILMFSYSFNSIYETFPRKYLFISILIILGISLLWGTSFELGEERRSSGMFVNPNNLSLMSLSLLLLLNENKDSFKFHIVVNFVVIFFLVISTTSGAIIAYFIANVYRFRTKLLNHKKKIVLTMTIFLVTMIILSYLVNFNNYQITNKIINQTLAVREYISESLYTGNVNYYNITLKYGYSSAVWRLEQWRKILSIFKNSDFLNILFGHGIGCSKLYFDNLPHNEYLRTLFEFGFIGFLLFMSFFLFLYYRIDFRYRYLILMFAIYSFTENNLDNFLFVTIFVMFISTSQVIREKK